MDDEKFPDIKYKPLTYYAITLNPKNSYQFTSAKDIQFRLQKYVTAMRRLLNPIHSISYLLWNELSEPNSSYDKDGRDHIPRLHMHGIIMIHDVGEFLLKDYVTFSLIGNIKIHRIDSMSNWFNYCTKQQQMFEFPLFCNSKDFARSIKIQIKSETGVTGDSSPPPQESPAEGNT